MERKSCYVLRVHYYPHAIEHNVTPMESGFAPGYPGAYFSHTLQFDHPPTPEDFTEVVNQLPWAKEAWGETLIPLLQFNNWPYLQTARKACTTNLYIQDEGVNKQVGHLEISKKETWINEQYPSILITQSMINKSLKGYTKEKSVQIETYIIRNTLRIIGNVVTVSKSTGTSPDENVIVAEIKKIIQEWNRNEKQGNTTNKN